MKAVILAGGKGTRLLPLTENTPKPLLNLCGKPAICHILDLLKTHRCDTAAVTLMYRGKKIERYFDTNDYNGITLCFSYEDKPLGTAGSVRLAASSVDLGDEPFVVISGDALCNINLTSALKFHREHNAKATIITVKRDIPTEYGVVKADERGRVTGFIEKPSMMSCNENRVNTGVYILSPSVLELIPDSFCDFACDLFPTIIGNGLYSQNQECYWCDIGDLQSYRLCQADMLNGITDSKIEGTKDMQSGYSLTRLSRRGNIFKPPYYIGRNVIIGENTEILDGTVIEDNVTIGNDCKIYGAVVGKGAFIGDNVRLNGCIIGNDASVSSDSAVYENAVIGDKSRLGSGSILKAGVKMYGETATDNDVTISEDIRKGGDFSLTPTDSGYKGEVNITVTPSVLTRLGAALAAAADGGSIAVACKSGEVGYTMSMAVLSGIGAAGCDAIDCKAVPLSVLIHKSRLAGCSLCCYISGGKTAEITVLTGGGLPITRYQEREIEGVLYKGGSKRADYRRFGRIHTSIDSGILYTAMLTRNADFQSEYNIKLDSTNRLIKEYAEPAFYAVSNPVGESMIISIDYSGTKAEIYTPETDTVKYEQLLLIIFTSLLQKGEKIALPFNLLLGMESISPENILRLSACSQDNSDAAARGIAALQPFVTDGCVLALSALNVAAKKGISFKQLIDSLPGYSVCRKYLPLEKDKRVGALSALAAIRECDDSAEMTGDGVVISRANDKVLIHSSRGGDGLYLYAQSLKAETAEELCRLTLRQVKQQIKRLESEKS